MTLNTTATHEQEFEMAETKDVSETLANVDALICYGILLCD